MPYPFQVTFRPDGTDITTTLWVDDRQEIANAISPEYCNDWSADVNQMRETADPGDVGSESLAVDLAGELRRLRFKIKQIADRLNGSPVAQWYSSFPGDLAIADGGTGASDAAGARANLGLGTLSTQNANAVNITGGTIATTNINNATMGGSATTFMAKILANQGAGGLGNPNNAGYVFNYDDDTGFFEAVPGGPIDVYIDGVKKYGFGGTFFNLLTGQIKFPSSQIASSDPNILDDYEEGSWTPSFARSTFNPTISYNMRVGRYIKIGRFVFASFHIDIATVSAQGSGSWYIGGIPFSPDSSVELAGGGGIAHYSHAFSTKNNHLAVDGSSHVGFIMIDSNGVYDYSSSIVNSTEYAGVCVYLASS